MTNYYSEGKDQAFIQPGPAGSVLTSNGPTLLPSYQGGSQVGVTEIYGNYQALATDSLIEAEGPNSQQIILPSAGTMAVGARLTIKVSGQGVPVVVVAPTGTNIDYQSSVSLTPKLSALTLEWDGEQYFIVNQYTPSAETILLDKWLEEFDAMVRPRVFPMATYVASGAPYPFSEYGVGDLVDKFEAHFPDIINRIPGRSVDLYTQMLIDANLLTLKEAVRIEKFGPHYPDWLKYPYPLATYVASGSVRVPTSTLVF